MSIQSEAITMSSTSLVSVDFHGTSLIIFDHNGDPHVAIKPIAEALGLDWEGQRQRIQRDEILSEGVFIIKVQMPDDDQQREVTALKLSMLNGWLFGIDHNRVKPEIRESILTYKRECYDALYKHWSGQVSQPQGPVELFSARDKYNLQTLIDDMSRGAYNPSGFAQGLWKRIRRVANCPSPNHFHVAHIPLIAGDLQTLYPQIMALRDRLHGAERDFMRRVLVSGGDADGFIAGLDEAEREVEGKECGGQGMERWRQNGLAAFATRTLPGHWHKPRQRKTENAGAGA